MVYYQKMTPEGYQEIKDEIARLKKDRPGGAMVADQTIRDADANAQGSTTMADLMAGQIGRASCRERV